MADSKEGARGWGAADWGVRGWVAADSKEGARGWAAVGCVWGACAIECAHDQLLQQRCWCTHRPRSMHHFSQAWQRTIPQPHPTPVPAASTATFDLHEGFTLQRRAMPYCASSYLGGGGEGGGGDGDGGDGLGGGGLRVGRDRVRG